MKQKNYTFGNENARKYGVHEIELHGDELSGNPFFLHCEVIFTPPSGKSVKVYAFYDGDHIWRARVYVNETGIWHWTSLCDQFPSLNGKSGSFTAMDSELQGMLRKHPDNPSQWMTDRGSWFLNISDTAYLLFMKSNTLWQKYVEDDAALNITSLRCGALGGLTWDRDSDISNYPWDGDDLESYNLEKFQTTDERLKWMLDHYPNLYIQMILFGLKTWGKDDTGPLWKALSQTVRENTMRYMISRWAAFPQLFWLIVNDMHCTEEFPENQAFVREVGKYFALHDPWHHLLSTGPKRQSVFPFLTEEDLTWVSYIHIEDKIAMDAEVMNMYKKYDLHVFLGEDRYEQDRFDPECMIKDPDYYFRWLFWSWLLSGGSANYGGRWSVIHPYSMTTSLEYSNYWGDKEKFRAGLVGLNSVKHIQPYFERHKISLHEFTPDPQRVLGMDHRNANPYIKLMRRGNEKFLVYHPNTEKCAIDSTPDEESTAQIRIDLGNAPGAFAVEWFHPGDGSIITGKPVTGSTEVTLTAPWKGKDVVLYLQSLK